MTDAAKMILDRWLDAVNSGDLDRVLSLYAEEAVLVPTFSISIMTTPSGIRDYFTGISRNGKVSVRLDADSLVVQDLGSGLYSLGGRYTWGFQTEGPPRQVRARFSYVVDSLRKRPILKPHSSELPEG